MVVATRCEVAGALKTAKRFCNRLAASPVLLDHGVRLNVTVSVGVAAAPEEAVDSPAELLARADQALYRAKAEGRNQVRGPLLWSAEQGDALRDGWMLTAQEA